MTGRLAVLYICFVIVFAIISVRLFYWQIISSERLSALAQSQRISQYTIQAKRGTITSSDGSDLVINQHAYLVYAEPQNIKETKKTVDVLSEILDISESTISALLSDTTVKWKPIAKHVDTEKKERLSSVDLPGVGFIQESRRFYPEGSMAAHILGFVGNNEKGEDQGYFGIEGRYDEQLRGRDGRRREENDALGHPILLGNMTELPTEDGRHLTLTIDKTMQFIVERELLNGIERFGAKGGTVTVMDPHTGALLAMASYPSYDPFAYWEYPSEYYKNPVVASTYEPGSTFKVLVVASALQQGAITPQTTYIEEGPIRIGGYTIRTWNDQYHGVVDPRTILQHSSNVGMVYIQRDMGGSQLLESISQLGFGELTGVDLEDETAIPLRQKSAWREIDYATSSFGQGIAVTPLQMIRAVASLANGGKLMKPYIVKQIRTPHGKVIDTKPVVERTMYTSSVSASVAEMMQQAVDQGEAKYRKPKGYRISGKTGTAQVAIGGQYDATKTIASFVGFAPTDDPAFIMLVTIDQPTSSPWGSETAAPLSFLSHESYFNI